MSLLLSIIFYIRIDWKTFLEKLKQEVSQILICLSLHESRRIPFATIKNPGIERMVSVAIVHIFVYDISISMCKTWSVAKLDKIKLGTFFKLYSIKANLDKIKLGAVFELSSIKKLASLILLFITCTNVSIYIYVSAGRLCVDLDLDVLFVGFVDGLVYIVVKTLNWSIIRH